MGTEEEADIVERVSKMLWITLGPIVFTLGCVGNVIILLVLRKGHITATVTNVYVTLIATFDLITLLFGMVNEWLKVLYHVTSFNTLLSMLSSHTGRDLEPK